MNGRPLASVPQAHIAVTCLPSAHIRIALLCGISFFRSCLVAVTLCRCTRFVWCTCFAVWCTCFAVWCTCFAPFALANPTDMTTASNATANGFSILSAPISGGATLPRLSQLPPHRRGSLHFCWSIKAVRHRLQRQNGMWQSRYRPRRAPVGVTDALARWPERGDRLPLPSAYGYSRCSGTRATGKLLPCSKKLRL